MYDQETKQRARALRKNATPQEHRLWSVLRELRSTHGVKFRRQHPMPPYIVDFFCLKARLIVEVDGFSHDGERYDNDQKRQLCLTKQGYSVIRFTNDEVMRNTHSVAQAILSKALKLKGSSTPPAKTKDLLA